MKKISTKVRRVIVLVAMFVFMVCTTIFAAIHYVDFMDCELTVYGGNGQKRCVAKTIATTSEFRYSFLDVTITYNDSSEHNISKNAEGVGVGAVYYSPLDDVDCFDTEHEVQNSIEQIGNHYHMSSN
ncbi:MAG: hypothetical protein PUB04_01775 [Clostridia bacterium]|nr:hypothetical protein [Clostridia bacterium]